MVGQITGKMFDHPIEKDCVSDLSDPGSCRTGKCCNLKFSCTAVVQASPLPSRSKNAVLQISDMELTHQQSPSSYDWEWHNTDLLQSIWGEAPPSPPNWVLTLLGLFPILRPPIGRLLSVVNDHHLMIILMNKRLKTSWLGQIKSWVYQKYINEQYITNSIVSWIGEIRSRAAQPQRGEPAVRLPLGGFHLQKILLAGYAQLLISKKVQFLMYSYPHFLKLSSGKWESKYVVWHQTNISLTILPFHHSHNHGKFLYAPHSDCHQCSHRANR